eukprot:ctg_754.g452
MHQRDEPQLQSVSSAERDYTRVRFVPDLERFGVVSGALDADTLALMVRRVFDMAGILPGVTVSLNGTALPVESFTQYAALHGEASADALVVARLNPHWEAGRCADAGVRARAPAALPQRSGGEPDVRFPEQGAVDGARQTGGRVVAATVPAGMLRPPGVAEGAAGGGAAGGGRRETAGTAARRQTHHRRVGVGRITRHRRAAPPLHPQTRRRQRRRRAGVVALHPHPHRRRLGQGAGHGRPERGRSRLFRHLPVARQAAQCARLPPPTAAEQRGDHQCAHHPRPTTRPRLRHTRVAALAALRQGDADDRPGSRRQPHQGPGAEHVRPLLAIAAGVGRFSGAVHHADREGHLARAVVAGARRTGARILPHARLSTVVERVGRSERRPVAHQVLQRSGHFHQPGGQGVFPAAGAASGALCGVHAVGPQPHRYGVQQGTRGGAAPMVVGGARARQ